MSCYPGDDADVDDVDVDDADDVDIVVVPVQLLCTGTLMRLYA